MPIYNYRCIECRQPDTRVAGLDDHMAVCHVCRGVMLRTDQDVFAPVFADSGGDPGKQASRGEPCVRPEGQGDG